MTGRGGGGGGERERERRGQCLIPTASTTGTCLSVVNIGMSQCQKFFGIQIPDTSILRPCEAVFQLICLIFPRKTDEGGVQKE